jgi:hypothetical protein
MKKEKHKETKKSAKLHAMQNLKKDLKGEVLEKKRQRRKDA